MTTTLSLFTEPFTMPDGTTRRALVERVPEIERLPLAMLYCTIDMAGIHGMESKELQDASCEALLIVAAHRWVCAEADVPDRNERADELLECYGTSGVVDLLVDACHLIADAIDRAREGAK